MARQLDETLAEAAIALMVPWSRTHPGEDDLGTAVGLLVRDEQFRRGAPDPLTGALRSLALMQGARLKSEFDLSIHAHTGWSVGVVIVDVKELIRINALRGMPAGDEVLKAAAATLRGALPGVPLLRPHGDCLAALFLPSTGLQLGPADLDRASSALRETAELLTSRGLGAEGAIEFTVSALRLRIFDPSHWEVLGPLLLAEIERANVLARRGLATGIQERELRLDGRVPIPRG